MPTEELQVAPPKQTLMQIADSLIEIFAILESASDEDKPAVQEELQRVVAIDLAKKTDGIGWALDIMSQKVDGYRTFIDEIEDRIARVEKQKLELREITKCAMQKMGVTQIKGEFRSISITPPRESLRIVDASLVPDKYKTEKEITTIDNAAIKRDLKAKVLVPGAELVPGVEGITVR